VGRSDAVEDVWESDEAEDTDEDAGGGSAIVVVVVPNVVNGSGMVADEEVAGGGTTVVVVVVSVVDKPERMSDAEKESGEAVGKDKLVVSDLWMMLVSIRDDEETGTVAELVGRGTGMTIVVEDGEEDGIRLELPGDGNTVTVVVVVERLGVVEDPGADEEVAIDTITVVVVVVTVVDDARIGSDAELEDTGAGTTTTSEGEAADPDIETKLT
jgi:hypothetical protein